MTPGVRWAVDRRSSRCGRATRDGGATTDMGAGVIRPRATRGGRILSSCIRVVAAAARHQHHG